MHPIEFHSNSFPTFTSFTTYVTYRTPLFAVHAQNTAKQTSWKSEGKKERILTRFRWPSRWSGRARWTTSCWLCLIYVSPDRRFTSLLPSWDLSLSHQRMYLFILDQTAGCEEAWIWHWNCTRSWKMWLYHLCPNCATALGTGNNPLINFKTHFALHLVRFIRGNWY